MTNATRTCEVDGCSRPHNARGWCLPHYKRWQKYGDPLGVHVRRTACSVEGCVQPWRTREWCSKHYQRWQRHGSATAERVRQVCAVDGCSLHRVAHGLCSKHNARMVRHGSPTARIAGEVVEGKRACSCCGEDRPLSDYYRGRAGRCARCRRAYNAAPERRARRRIWAQKNADYMRDYARSYASLRRLRTFAAVNIPFTKEQLDSRMQFFGSRCWMCRGEFEHIDHVKPLSKGGPHILANMRPACGSCNRSKSANWEGVAGVVALAA